MMDVRPRISRGRIATRMKLVASSFDATASTGPRPLSNHAPPGVIRRAGASPTVTSSVPATRHRMPPPRWRCGSATPPGANSTRSARIKYSAWGSSAIACSSTTRVAPARGSAAGAAPGISSHRHRVAPALSAVASHAPTPCHACPSATRASRPALATTTPPRRAEITMNCGRGPVTVSPAPFVETGTGWFVDGRGFVVTNAHVVDPAFRLPKWVTHELKKKAIDLACVDPQLRTRGLTRGMRPDLEEDNRREATGLALPSARVETQPQITVLLSDGIRLKAEVKKFDPPLLIDNANRPLPGSGRDLALLRVRDGIYPAIGLAARDGKIGDPVHILAFP